MKIVIGIVVLGIIFFIVKGAFIPTKRERSSSRRCANCGSTIPFTARVCPYCRMSPGSDWRSESKVYGRDTLSGLKWFAILVGAFVLLWLVGSYFGLDLSAIFGS